MLLDAYGAQKYSRSGDAREAGGKSDAVAVYGAQI